MTLSETERETLDDLLTCAINSLVRDGGGVEKSDNSTVYKHWIFLCGWCAASLYWQRGGAEISSEEVSEVKELVTSRMSDIERAVEWASTAEANL